MSAFFLPPSRSIKQCVVWHVSGTEDNGTQAHRKSESERDLQVRVRVRGEGLDTP